MTLQPYQKDRPCPKCLHVGATTEYLPHKTYPYWGSCDNEASSQHVEHLHRHCGDCCYEWCEALAVSPVNSEGLTPEEVTE